MYKFKIILKIGNKCFCELFLVYYKYFLIILWLFYMYRIVGIGISYCLIKRFRVYVCGYFIYFREGRGLR